VSTQTQQNRLITALTLVALVAMIAAFFAPIWWVSLTAPNYPKDAFPDGIRIHFHFDSVQNGCRATGTGSRMAGETMQADMGPDSGRYNPILDAAKDVNKDATGLDCVHEMNTINHYVGMFPIATGAPVERPMAKYFFGMFAVMLLGFITPMGRKRTLVLSAGFAGVAAWTVAEQLLMGHLAEHVKHYVAAAATFFNEPARLKVWGDNVTLYTQMAIGGMIASMLVLVVGTARWRSFSLLLVGVPALLPVFFVIEYAGWLWFFGHNMHPWGAFTVKPFMPTLFGEGKVAQFSTYSYPYWGYGLLLVTFACLTVAMLLRRKQLREQASD
jgi:hypothetical protein